MLVAMRIAERVLCSGLLLFAVRGLAAAADSPIEIWPGGAPGPKATKDAEVDTTKPGDHMVAGKAVIRIGNVTSPTMTLYAAPENKNTGAAVLVFPGGGYRILAIDLEGTEICSWLNSIGVNAILLKYRVPEPEGLPRYQEPLQDAQRAMGLIRLHARQWHIDPHRIGVLGFSAGGDLAAVLSTNFEKRAYTPVDAADAESCRPDFAVIIYPGYLTATPGDPDQLASELTVTANTPPAFLVQAEDDPVHVENSMGYFLALKRAGAPAEMHLYSKGGHGYGMRPTDDAVTTWPARAEDWLRSMKELKPAVPSAP